MAVEFSPAYMALYQSGQLRARVESAQQQLVNCQVCGWQCGIDRRVELGPCRTGINVLIATAYVHFGEERPLTTGGGSGTVFFSNCDLRCQFCQTSRWNIKGAGREISVGEIARIMLRLQQKGAANINLVTPTHIMPQILSALLYAVKKGLRLPLVWNSGGYDSLQALKLLDGIVDIYLPDMKYGLPGLGRTMSGVPDYESVNRAAVREMYRQVGNLEIASDGKARRGVLVRHLVMPGHFANTKSVLDWIRQHLGENTYISLMDQYRPAYRAFARDDIGRPITIDEYQQARSYAQEIGLKRLDDQLTLLQGSEGD